MIRKSNSVYQPSDLLTLNVAGEKKIKVTRAILTKIKDSNLEAMFSGKHELNKVDGGIYLDRDVDVFEMVISFLRNGFEYPLIDSELLRRRFEMELDHWGLIHEYKSSLIR